MKNKNRAVFIAANIAVFSSLLVGSSVSFAAINGSGTTTFVGVFNGATNITGFSPFTYTSSTQKLVFPNASGTNLSLSGFLTMGGQTTLASVSFVNASGTNISVTGYGIFPTLGFTNASGTNISVTGYGIFPTLNATNAALTNVSSTNIAASGSVTVGTPIGVSSGGTATSSFNYGVVTASGTQPFNTIAPGTSGNILTSNGSAWVSAAPITPTSTPSSTFPDRLISSFVAGENINKGDAVYMSNGSITSTGEIFTTPFFTDPNIVSYYRFEGNSNDLVGGNNGGDSVIAYSLGNGKFEQGAGFNGVSSYISYAPGTLFNSERTQPFTLTYWVKSTQTTNIAFISNLDQGSGYRGKILYGSAHTSGDLELEMINDNFAPNALKVNTGPIGWNDGNWHMITVTYDGSSAASGVNIYLDGVIKASPASSDNLSATIVNSAITYVGQFGPAAGTPTFLAGSLDDLALFSRAFSPAEVLTLYNGSTINNGTAGEIYRANATNPIYSNGFIGFADSSISLGNIGNVVTGGVANVNGLTVGKQYYLSNSSGAINVSTGITTRKVGIAVGTSTLLITNIW